MDALLDAVGFGAVTPTWLLVLLLAAIAAGWVDAVVGGGGLIQLPVLLLVPGIDPVAALGTNKLAGICGTSTSAITYARRLRPDLRLAGAMASCALAGAVGGALVATVLPSRVFLPIVLVSLMVAGLYVAFHRDFGGERREGGVSGGNGIRVLTVGAGMVIGFYDGLVGPGTGTFLVLVLVALTGYDFVEASGVAKIVNVATNLGGLLVFIPHGSVLWGPGLMMALANAAGGYLGARTAVTRGSGFVRVIFLVVVLALCVRIGWTLLA